MRSRRLIKILTLALIGATSSQASAERQSAAVIHRDIVKPLLVQHCLKCHGEKDPDAGVSLVGLTDRVTRENGTSVWAKVLDQLELGAMPPKDEPQPAGADKKQVMDWIETELGHAGILRDGQLLQRPEFGNYVDHKKLFDGSITEPSYSTPRVWRLRAGLLKFGSPFPASDVDYAALQIIDEPMTLRMRAMSEKIADQLLPYLLGHKEPHRNSRHNPETTRAFGIPKLADPSIYENQSQPDRANIEADVATLFRAFVRRPPTDAERKRYADFLEGMLKTESDRVASLATVMRAMVMTPESVYRLELGLGETLSDGRRMLSPGELAIAVPMSLGHTKTIGGLATRADVERAVRGILKKDHSRDGPSKTPHGVNRRLIAFIHGYFGYDQAPEVFKGGERVPKHHRGIGAGGRAKAPPVHLVEETDEVVAAILREDKDVLRQLLTTDQIIMRYRMDYYLDYYGFKPDDDALENEKNRGPFKSPIPRAGILTQPSWLIAHSRFTDNHVVHRGKWIREKLLGGTIPEVPVGVDAAIPDTADMPLRERLKQTKSEFCWRCHQKMDPLGWPFELYDDFGRYRADGKERLINGEVSDVPVDTSGAITGTGIPELDGPVSGPIELMHRLADSDHVRQVFVRHVFRFFLGRNETLADSQTLIRADKAYVESGGSLEELVVSILTSDSFLYRKDPAVESPRQNSTHETSSKRSN